MADGRNPMTPVLVAQLRSDAGLDAFPLHRPGTVIRRGDSLYVVDTGNDRIVVFDLALHPVRSIGRSGSGPGEFEIPTSAVFRRDTLIVANFNNHRIDFYDGAGSYARTLPLPVAPYDFAATSSGRIILPIDDSLYYAALVNDDGGFTRVAPRPRAREAGHGRTSGRAKPFVATLGDEALFVFDNETGALFQYTLDGYVSSTLALPRALLQRIRDRHDRLVGGLVRQGIRVHSMPLAKSLNATDEGTLVLLLSDKTVPALVIDPRAGTVREIRTPDLPSDSRPLTSASSMALHGSWLYAVGDEGLFSYRIAEPSNAN